MEGQRFKVKENPIVTVCEYGLMRGSRSDMVVDPFIDRRCQTYKKKEKGEFNGQV